MCSYPGPHPHGQAAAVTNELHDLKQDVASIKQLLQVLVQLQAPSLQGVQGTPALLRQLQTAQGAIERGGSLAAPLGVVHGERSDAAAAAAGKAELPKLTAREREILELVGEGKLNREIAVELGVTKGHVEKYVKRLLDKTGTTNRTELVRKALRIGLLASDSPMGELPAVASMSMVPVLRPPPEAGRIDF